jgi:hypothetical protein
VHFTVICAELKSFRPAYLDGLKLCIHFNCRLEAAHTGAPEQCPLVCQHSHASGRASSLRHFKTFWERGKEQSTWPPVRPGNQFMISKPPPQIKFSMFLDHNYSKKCTFGPIKCGYLLWAHGKKTFPPTLNFMILQTVRNE